ncbi:hypothetical protein OIV83_001600 [Microbotryomycetes sp. JL201]|nr:hypothetical protein OIV83_001600 [Microbotryomycetes sp. JL201]
MSFLRKWGSSGPSNAAANAAQQADIKAEWHSETPGERYYGLENFGNTCYANSVLQSLYFSRPFRELVEAYAPPCFPPPSPSASLPVSSLSTGSGPPPPQPQTPHSTFSQLKATPSRSSTTPTPPLNAPASSKSGFFGHKRSGSVNLPPEQAPPPPANATESNLSQSVSSSSSFGQPLTQVTSQTSFAGVGTPVQNGILALNNLPAESTLLTTLHDLFAAISSQPKPTGTVAPQAFINQLKKDNEFFRSTLHQDAHEFLNFLVNTIAESLEKEQTSNSKTSISNDLPNGLTTANAKTWVHRLFEGVLTNETRCLTCETVTSRDEAFLDLSIDIEQNTSVTSCLRQFSASEMLCQRNKFSCDTCCGLQEAEKRMKIKKLPNILALHLKRFKYEESLQRHVKLAYRVVFPFELRLFNTSDHVANPDRLYELWAIVVHIGAGPTHGHYITIVKSGARWIVFDDVNVYPIDQSDISKFFGDTPGHGSGYVLFYQAVDLDLGGLELPSQKRDRTLTASTAATDPLSNKSQPAVPASASGLGLSLSHGEPIIDTSKPLVSEPALIAVNSIAPSAITPPALFGGAAGPAADDSRRANSTTDGASGQTQKEGSSWATKSRKVSGVLGRSLSLATAISPANKNASSSASTPVTDRPEAVEERRPSEISLDTSVADSARSSWIGTTPSAPGTPIEPPNGSLQRTPPTGSLLSVTPAHPAPPSEDGSNSTASTQGMASGGGLFSSRRRGSRASVDLSASASTASSSTGQGNAPSGTTSGALSATRNFLTRKPRPLSSVASTSSVPTTRDFVIAPATSSTARPSGRPSTAPSTGGPLADTGVPPPMPTGLVAPASSTMAGESQGATSSQGEGSVTESQSSLDGRPLQPTQSVILTKKELEKKAKEEKKLQVKEEKERAKALKEEAKRQKQETKMADKLKRKMSVR